jgi:hypothetical protein
MQGDPGTVAGHGAFGALFASVNRAATEYLATTGDLVIDPPTARSARSKPINRS